MNLRALFRRREPAASAPAPEAVVSAGSTPITCAEAGRALAATRYRNDRDHFRATAVLLAERIGRPDLAKPLR